MLMHKMMACGLVAGAFVASAPVRAQETEAPAADLSSKSDEELVRDLLNLFKDVSNEMQSLQDEMARASLPSRSVEQRVGDLQSYAEKLKAGEASELPQGLREYLAEHPERLVELLGVTRDEALAIAKDEATLLEKLKAAGKGIDPILEDAEALKDILSRQLKIDEQLQAVLDRQARIAELAAKNIDDTLEHAYEARDRFGCNGGSCKNPKEGEGLSESQPQAKKQGKKEGEKNDSAKGNGKPTKAATSEYNPDGRPVDGDDAGSERVVKNDSWEVEKSAKEHEDAASSDESSDEPSLYKGFARRFHKKIHGTEEPAEESNE